MWLNSSGAHLASAIVGTCIGRAIPKTGAGPGGFQANTTTIAGGFIAKRIADIFCPYTFRFGSRVVVLIANTALVAKALAII